MPWEQRHSLRKMFGAMSRDFGTDIHDRGGTSAERRWHEACCLSLCYEECSEIFPTCLGLYYVAPRKFVRIGNGVGKQGYGNRPPIDDRNLIKKFSIDPLYLQNQWDNSASTDSPRQRIKEKSRYGNSVSTPHRRYGHRLRTPFLRTPFLRLLKPNCPLMKGPYRSGIGVEGVA